MRLPWGDLDGHAWTLEDQLTATSFERSGDEMASEGLYVALATMGVALPGFLISPGLGDPSAAPT